MYKMRQIELKNLLIKSIPELLGPLPNGEDRPAQYIDYKKIITELLLSPQNQKGGTFAEIEEIRPILDQLRTLKEGEFLELNETQYGQLKARVAKLQVPINYPEWLIFRDDIAGAEEIERPSEPTGIPDMEDIKKTYAAVVPGSIEKTGRFKPL